MEHPRFRDRRAAGRALSAELRQVLANPPEAGAVQSGSGRPLILALPRGGLPVAVEVAEALGGELDVLVVRKVGVPAHPELAMGALAMLGGTVETVRNNDVLEMVPGAADPGGAFEIVAEREAEELRRRDAAYRQGQPPVDLAGRTVILVDDGLATGASMRAALTAARRREPAQLVAAVPVGARRTLADLEDLADHVVSAWSGDNFEAVGQAYENFPQTGDDEVRDIISGYGRR